MTSKQRDSCNKGTPMAGPDYRLLFERSPDGIVAVNQRGEIVFANEAAAAGLGYTLDEFLALRISDFEAKETREEFERHYADMLRGERLRFETFHRRKDGSLMGVEVVLSLTEQDGEVIGYSFWRDITERKRMEADLLLFNEIVTSMAEGVALTRTADGTIVYANPTFERMFGYDRGELEGKNVTVLNAPGEESPNEVSARIQAQLASTGGWSGVIGNVKKDGTPFWCSVSVSTLDHHRYGKVWVGVHQDITARKRAEEALRESESRYRSIAETSMDVIYRLDQNGTVVYASPSVLPVLGYTEEEATGRNFLGFVHDEDQGKAQEAFATLLQRRSVKSRELRVLKKTGGFIHSEINVSPILDKNGVMEIQGVIHNITERKSAEEEVKRLNQDLERIVAVRTIQLEEANRVLRLEVDARRRSEESLLLIKDCLESLPLGVSIVDTAGRIMYVNPADAEMHGHAREDLVGRDIGVYAAPAARKAMSFEELSSRGSWKRESVNVRKDGKAFPVHLMSRAVRNREGDPFGIITACEDITERKRAEEALREGERKHRELATQLKTVLDAIPDMMMLLTPDLQVQWINRAADKEDRPLSLRKVLCCDVLGTCEKKEDACFAAETLRTGAKQERRHVFPDGRIAEIRTFPVRNEAGGLSHILVSLTDATDKVRMQEETERSRRLAALGELAAGVAHEINNPITSIINYGQLLADDGAPGSAFAEYGGRIIRDGERVAEIVKSMLSFARQQPAERTRCGVQRILREAGLMVESQLKKEGIVLHIDLDPGLPDVEAAVQQLLQVLFNLISNARHALNEKQHEAGRAKSISIRGEAVDEAGRTLVRLRVRDNGTGIPRSKLGMVFQPFFTTKPVGKGTGLGLSVCHGIIEAHGGTLKIESEEGQYTEAIIDLPAGRFESDGRTA